MKTYEKFSDPGHGWLMVKRAELNKLGLINKISGYSYQRGDYVYLEEDCDCKVFLDKLQRRSIEYRIGHSVTYKQSRIRGYDSFCLREEENRTMSEYLVVWKIEVDAESAEGAAQSALEIMRDPQSRATFFDVTGKDGVIIEIDTEG